MKNSMKNLIVISIMMMGLFGIIKAEETTTVTTTVETTTTDLDQRTDRKALEQSVRQKKKQEAY